MAFKDKYKIKGDSNPDKIEVSNDAFLNAEMIENLINKLERIRGDLI